MTGSIDTNRSLAYGLVLSIAFHAAAVMGLVNQGVFSGGRGTESVLVIPPPEEDRAKAEEPPKLKEEEPPPLKLGIEDSTADTKTWIGFKDPTPHSGLKSDVEQAQVAIDPGGAPPAPMGEETQEQGEKADEPEAAPQPAQSSPPTPPAPSAEGNPPAPAPPEEPRPAEPEVNKPESVPAPAAPIEPAERPVEPDPEILPSESEPEDLPTGESPEALPEFSEQPTPVEKPPLPEQVPPAPAPVAPPPTPAVPPPQPGRQETTAAAPPKPAKELKTRSDFAGIADDRIAVATAIKDAVQVVPGRPVAAKGMRIRTIPPRPSVTTQLTAAPRNAVMWVIFGADGKVKDTDFFAGQSTGSEGWDGALRSAVFAWRASGEEIDRLSKTDPRAGVSVMFRITMR